MLSRRSIYSIPLVLVLIVLIGAVSGCTSGDADVDHVWDLSDGTATAVTKTGEVTPTPIQSGGPVPASIISPITATFYEQTTEYRVTIGSPVDPGEWSKSNLCGDADVDSDGYRLTWKHPHPPCDETSNHADQEILFTVEIPTYQDSMTVQCKYQGAAPGTGDPCTWLR